MKIKKSVFITSLLVCGLVSGAIGVGASNGIQKIQAALNHNIQFVLDGSNWTPKDSNGNKLSALVYDGSTYVPLRVVSEALGAEVKWNGSTQKITINSGSSNIGIPYKDGEDSKNTNPSGSSSNTQSGLFTYKSSFSATTAEEELKAEAVKLLRIYGEALETEDMSAFNAYIDAHVTDKTSKSSFTKQNYFLGRQYNKDRFKKTVEAVISSNTSSVLSGYAKALKTVTASDIESTDPTKYETLASFQYFYSPEGFSGWNSSSSAYFLFSVLDDGTYALDSVKLDQ